MVAVCRLNARHDHRSFNRDNRRILFQSLSPM
jgi:hypothetical protein